MSSTDQILKELAMMRTLFDTLIKNGGLQTETILNMLTELSVGQKELSAKVDALSKGKKTIKAEETVAPTTQTGGAIAVEATKVEKVRAPHLRLGDLFKVPEARKEFLKNQTFSDIIDKSEDTKAFSEKSIVAEDVKKKACSKAVSAIWTGYANKKGNETFKAWLLNKMDELEKPQAELTKDVKQ